jgi:ERF superfamily
MSDATAPRAVDHFEFPEPAFREEHAPQPIPIKVVVRKSERIGELVAALAKAQLEFQPVLKDQKNPYYNSKYADLSTVISATQQSLAKNGLVIMQQPSVDVEKQRVTVTSTLAHSSDQWIENELTLPAIMLAKDGKPRFDAQSCGAAITYGRRYSYQGLAGVAAELDDDGNAAVGIGSKDASREVAKEKLKGSVASLFYLALPSQEDAYEITGAESLMQANREVLKKFWNRVAGAVIVNGEQLEGLKYTFEQAGVPFVLLKK